MSFRFFRSHTRRKIALALLFITIALEGGYVLYANARSLADSLFRNSQAFYAEIATTSTQGVVAAATSTTIHIPIVVYHIVRPSYPDDSLDVKNFAQTPELFDAQLHYLRDARYTVISFHDLDQYFAHNTLLPKNPIIITFDDGWGSQFTYAFPILQKHHYTATFFVFTNPIGRHGFLTWGQLRTLRNAGMTIGSHSRSHPFLTKITPEALWKEIHDSKTTLERHLGIVVHQFAYPFGIYNPEIVALVKKAGYTSARGDLVSGEQSADQRYTLSALNAPTSLDAFKQKFPER